MRRVTSLIALVSGLGLTTVLTGCSSEPSIVGVWKADDGSEVKTISEDGSCTGMFYNGGKPLDIGGGMTCALGEKGGDGSYLLVVKQPPNTGTYKVKFVGSDTMELASSEGKLIVTLTRQ